jgi:hypothetical protein
MKTHNLYFNVRTNLALVERNTGLADLDFGSRAILEFVGGEEANDRVVTVMDVVRGAGIGTAPIVYSRMKILEGDGWIISEVDSKDRRVRLVALTAKAKRAYDQVGERLVQRVKEAAA